jgi:beta-lactam-binding protein with PASTA domain
VSTPPLEPDPADETVIIDGTGREIVEEEVVPPRRPPRLWPWLLALLLLVLAGLAAYLLIVRDDDKTVVPKVVGLTRTRRARGSRRRSSRWTSTAARATRKPGSWFAQSPGQGTQLDEGQTVEVLVSSGLTKVPVPNVIGLKEAEAVGRLETAKLEPKVERVFASAPKGEVVDQQPQSGEQVATGSAVTVKVSKGTNTKPVPDVIGLQEDEAISRLRDERLRAACLRRARRGCGGTVVAQEPEPGAKAPPDSSVRINVSTGEPTGETTERPGTTTPTTTGARRSPSRTSSVWPRRPRCAGCGPPASGASSRTARPTSREVECSSRARPLPQTRTATRRCGSSSRSRRAPRSSRCPTSATRTKPQRDRRSRTSASPCRSSARARATRSMINSPRRA